MAVWATVVATCLHHLKVDIWYVVKQKVIVWPAPSFTYKKCEALLLLISGGDFMTLVLTAEILVSHYCSQLFHALQM